MDLTSELAEEYAQWFQCLSDPTRLRILNFVTHATGPITVGDVVDAIGKSQSTVSRHLQILAVDTFVFMETDGVKTLVSPNSACMTALPMAAAAIMGSPTETDAP
ncbi:MAG: ArsR family transcriptional regulator [Verrucomicrobiales bacterium]|jgi:ArsR family transcriptional regulator